MWCHCEEKKLELTFTRNNIPVFEKWQISKKKKKVEFN